MNIGLVNFNRRGVREPGVPPVPPIGLEYLADELEAAGHDVFLLDLCFVDLVDRQEAIDQFVADKDFVGITFRNLGVDCYWLEDDQFYVAELRVVVQAVKRRSDLPVALGGQGFSIYPEQILEFAGADYGVAGVGETAFRDLVASYERLARGTVIRGSSVGTLPHRRSLIDYRRYIDAGGFPAVRTRAGCPFSCAFCVEARRALETQTLDAVMEEIKILLSYGAEFIFIADAEFNTHLRYAEAFCDRIIAEKLSFEWSTYLNTVPITGSLVGKMKEAGCVLPCVSIVSGDDDVLRALDANFSVEKIRAMGRHFRAHEMPFTVDVLAGGPRETRASIDRTFDLLEDIRPELVGMNFGLRLYKNTTLGQSVLAGALPTQGRVFGRTRNNPDFFFPVFYIADIELGDYLKAACDRHPRFNLLGHNEFGGVNYVTAVESS